MNPPEYTSLPTRFWDKVEVDDSTGCWEWTASLRGTYGQFWFNGQMHAAHRVAFQDAKGPIPDGSNVLHKCDNPPCVNSPHLFTGTQLDNITDRDTKRRQARGSRMGSSKLTAPEVLAIREIHSTQRRSLRSIGREFNVTNQSIHAIVSGNSWKHLLEKKHG